MASSCCDETKDLKPWPFSSKDFAHNLVHYQIYAADGLPTVRQLGYVHRKSPLDSYRELIRKHFEEHPPVSVKQARNDIEKLTGIKKSPTRIRIFMHQLGMEPRKVGGIPAKADPERQEGFKKILEPILEEARTGRAEVYFVDAAHFVMGAFLAILCSFRRIGQRLNVLGALNAVTKEMVTIINTNYINAWSVVELIRKIRKLHPPGKRVILILDNARYQAGYLVQSAAHMHAVELLFLPPYSPNLNLIERVWKFIRKKCLNCVYFKDFKQFSTAISDCIGKFGGEYKAELQTLLTWNFQTMVKPDRPAGRGQV